MLLKSFACSEFRPDQSPVVRPELFAAYAGDAFKRCCLFCRWLFISVGNLLEIPERCAGVFAELRGLFGVGVFNPVDESFILFHGLIVYPKVMISQYLWVIYPQAMRLR